VYFVHTVTEDSVSLYVFVRRFKPTTRSPAHRPAGLPRRARRMGFVATGLECATIQLRIKTADHSPRPRSAPHVRVPSPPDALCPVRRCSSTTTGDAGSPGRMASTLGRPGHRRHPRPCQAGLRLNTSATPQRARAPRRAPQLPGHPTDLPTTSGHAVCAGGPGAASALWAPQAAHTPCTSAASR
jgi:hypothetical protein